MELKYGSTGAEVSKIQKRLLDLSIVKDSGDKDGYFGLYTQSAVIAFQRASKLKTDGVVGPITWNALFTDTENRQDSHESILTQRALDLIVEFEVGGVDEYNPHPEWPEGASGVTIGLGYDLGYNTKEQFDKDFHALESSSRSRLHTCIGVTGYAAKKLLYSVKDIEISWQIAYDVFIGSTVPRFYEETRQAFNGLEKLPKDAQGALVSLVFNRGPLINNENRRREMREIRDFVPSGNLKVIAEQIRSMKRLWIGTSIENGMCRRREAEARLVESCIAA